MFKDIMVAITRLEGDETALSTGIELARLNDAHLAVVIPVEYPVPVPNEFQNSAPGIFASAERMGSLSLPDV